MKNPVYPAIVVLVILAGLYLWFQSERPNQEEITSGANEQSEDSESEVSVGTNEINSINDVTEILPSDSPDVEPVGIDYTGTHIMPDGSVMTGRGLIIPDAVITTDGMIRLKDGTELVPTADMRPESER